MKTINKILFGIAMTTALASCSSNTNKVKEDEALNVKVYQPTSQQAGNIFVSGVVSAKKTAMISTRIMGYVNRIYVKQGDVVKAGQLLMVINSDDIRAKRAQASSMITEAEAAYKSAERDYERFSKLHSKRSVSDKELENMELNKVSMRAKLQMARQSLREVNSMLEYTNIKAPFNGVITQKLIDEGSTASPGMPLLVIEQTGDLDVTASIPENYIQYMKTGDYVNIEIKSANANIKGRISELSPSASLTGGQYSMKVSLSPEDRAGLKAGMYAGIQIPGKIKGDGNNKVVIRKSSVVRKEQLTGVYVISEDNRAILRWVKLGKDFDDYVEVISGLNSKERIVQDINGKLYNGRKVNILK